MGELAAKWGPKGLTVIRSISGDNNLAALEFQKHYRLNVVHLLDVNRRFEKQYNSDGWPFLMVADPSGKIVYKVNDFIERAMPALGPLLVSVTEHRPGVKQIIRDGVAYMPATLKRNGEIDAARQRDSFPSLACGADGRVYVVFTSNRNGNSDVFMRVFDGKDWSADAPIAATPADEYDAVVAVDSGGRVWVSWTSNVDGQNYNIFLTSVKDPSQPAQPLQVTRAEDDAMHARMACGRDGRVWLTYYKWQKMGMYSRDKEVYVRFYDGTKFSDEIQVSPTDVPNYEDHTEPAIAACGDGVVVCWSWDFHRPDGYPRTARDPTVILRRVGADLELRRVVLVSGERIDATPAVAVDSGNRVWCAWDSLGWDRKASAYRKALYAWTSDLKAVSRPEQPIAVRERLRNVCTPGFAVSQNGIITLTWGQCSSGHRWTLKRIDFDWQKDRWSTTETVVSEGNPRFPSAAYDPQGVLWIAYSVDTDVGREIAVKQIRAGQQ